MTSQAMGSTDDPYMEPVPSTSNTFRGVEIRYEDSDDSIADPDFVFNEPVSSKTGTHRTENVTNDSSSTISDLEIANEPPNAKNDRSSTTSDLEITNEPPAVAGLSLRVLKQQKKKKRNTGQSYKTLKGKEIPERRLKALTPCRMKCKDRFSLEVRQIIFKEYWQLGCYTKRSSYMASLLDIEDKASVRIRTEDPDKQKFRTKTYKYNLIVNGKREPVCRGCLLKTLDESDNFIKTVALKKRSSTAGTETDDKRGKKTPKNKTSDEKRLQIKNHILSFPSYESHYTRKSTSKKYLPSHLTIQQMYDQYKLSRPSEQKHPSIKIYTQEFKKLKLSFKKPRADTCFTCDKFQMKIKLCSDEVAKQELMSEHQEHVQLGDGAYEEKALDTNMSTTDDTYQTYTFDLQQCLPTPMLKSSVAFYKRQLWTFNLTIHDNKTGKSYCYVWYETIAARGANQIASCLYKHICTMVPPCTKHITFYSDTCGGQNRNSHVTAMFTWVMQNTPVQTIDHKFMISGHSHLEVDTDHGIIEKKKKKTDIEIYHPHDWIQLIKSSGKKFHVIRMNRNDFLDFSSLLKGPLVLRYKDTTGDQFKWLEKRWLRYEKDFGIILFKNTLDRNCDFQTLNLKRRSSVVPDAVPVITNQPIPISKEKKDDLISLFPLIPDTFHSFYNNLPTSETARNTLPDVFSSEEESNN